MKRLMLKTLAAAVAISAFGAAFAQEKTIKFTTQNPKGHPLVMGMEKFAEIVQAKSGGKIKVKCEFCSAAYEFEPAEFSASWPAA